MHLVWVDIIWRIAVRISKKRAEISIDRLLAPLPVGDGVGDYLRYDTIYDQIRQARREDDGMLSQGIWEHDLKKADFTEVEQLAGLALEFRTKDLQIAGWLTESWLELDGLEGFCKGITLIKKLCQTYWLNIHPQEDDEGFEARIRFFEWMNEQFANRLMMQSLTFHSLSQEKPSLTLADWVSALNMETVAKRSNDYAKIISDAESKGKVTLAAFRKLLQTTDAWYLQKCYVFSTDTLDQIKALFEFLSQKLGKNASGFGRIRTCLDDIVRITKTALDQRNLPLTYSGDQHDVVQEKPIEQYPTQVETSYEELLRNIEPKTNQAPPPQDDVRTISGRREAYQALKELGQFLQNLDPHSPAPSLIEILVNWENKTLPAILEDLSKAPSNTQMLIRMLSSALPPQ
ncbi:MAG: hypothetical protein CNLJKLNK_00196 [Holosporales bacterium]